MVSANASIIENVEELTDKKDVSFEHMLEASNVVGGLRFYKAYEVVILGAMHRISEKRGQQSTPLLPILWI